MGGKDIERGMLNKMVETISINIYFYASQENSMQIRLIIFICIFLHFSSFGQASNDLNFYLSHKQVSKTAKDYYHNKFIAIDDDRTFSILDSLNTHNNETRPFYLYLTSHMLETADGALSEGMGLLCKEFVEKHPNYLMEFLYTSNKKIVTNNFAQNWINQIGGEFMIACDEKALTCSKKSFTKSTSQVSWNNRPFLVQFYNGIERYISQ